MLWSEVRQRQMWLPVVQGQATSIVLVQQGTHIVAFTCDHPPPAPSPTGSLQQLAGDSPGPAFSTMDFVETSASSYISEAVHGCVTAFKVITALDLKLKNKACKPYTAVK